ncbi:hypothetical protein AMTRI_Chr08g163210 [Amborella trichopoda]
MPKEIPSDPKWFTQYVGPLFFIQTFHWLFSNEGHLQILAIDPKTEEAIFFNATENSILGTHLGFVGYRGSLSIVGHRCSSVHIWVLVDYSGQVWEKYDIDLGILLGVIIEAEAMTSIVGYRCSSVHIWVLVDYSGQVWEKYEIDLGILSGIVIAPREEAMIGDDVGCLCRASVQTRMGNTR